MTTYEIRTSHWQINSLHRREGSKSSLVDDVKSALRRHGHRRPIASRWPDGTIAIYEDMSDRRRDQTGERAAAIVAEAEVES